MKIYSTIDYQLTTKLPVDEAKKIVNKHFNDPCYIVNCYSDYLTVSKSDALKYNLDRKSKKDFPDLFLSFAQIGDGCRIDVENKPSFKMNALSVFFGLMLLAFDYGFFCELFEHHFFNWMLLVPFVIMFFCYLIISSIFKMTVAEIQSNLIWILDARKISKQGV